MNFEGPILNQFEDLRLGSNFIQASSRAALPNYVYQKIFLDLCFM